MKHIKTFESFLNEGSLNPNTPVTKAGGQLGITKWLRNEIGTDKKAPWSASIYFDDADLVLGDKTVVTVLGPRSKQDMTLGELADILRAAMKEQGFEKLRPK